MQKFKNDYLERTKKYEVERNELDQKVMKRQEDINRAERSIQRLNKKISKLDRPSWVDTLIIPLAESLAKEFQMDYEIFGPFGLGARTSIYWKKDKKLSITEQETKSITLLPTNLELAQLYYETGHKRDDVHYQPRSIGALNGMDNEILPLPDSMEDIIKIIERKYAEKETI